MTADAARRNREDFSRRAGRFRNPLDSRESAPLEEAVSITGFGPGDTLVDIGIGTGNASLPFLKAGGRVAGIELTPAMARRGKEHLEKEGFGGRFVFANAEAERSPLAGGGGGRRHLPERFPPPRTAPDCPERNGPSRPAGRPCHHRRFF
jgi:SAM-dependent methyltransferase